MPPIIFIAAGFFSTAIILMAMVLVSVHLRRRQVTSGPATDEVARRLARLEEIAETTALEVERLSETNRFTAKLLAERAADRGGEGAPERPAKPGAPAEPGEPAVAKE